MGDSPSTKSEGRKRNAKTRAYEKSKTSYRAELNKKNREDGTYGNGDGKDKAHPKMNDQDEGKNRREGQAKGARNRRKKKTVLSRKKDE